MKRIGFVVTVASVMALMLGVAGAALAVEGAQTETDTTHNRTQTFDAMVPCTVQDATITTVTNSVRHTTELSDGTSHITGTVTGTFTAIITDGTTYTGHFTFRYGTNFNLHNRAGTRTHEYNLSVTAEDGTTIKSHSVEHGNWSASEPPKLNTIFRQDCGA